MADDASIPEWARHRPTLLRVSVALGAALASLLIGIALFVPSALGIVLDLIVPFLLIGLALVLLVVVGVRRAMLGPAHEQEVRRGALLVTYVLAALPLVVAALMLGALVAIALVFQWQSGSDLLRSFVLLIVGSAVFGMAVKTVLNAQILMRHWFGR